MTTFPGKNWESQRGFPTPDSTPETSACRTFRVPANDDWLGLLMAAAELLTDPYNFYNWGSLSPDTTADAWRDIVWQAYEDSESGCPTTTVDTPFWDDSADVDDQEEIATQTWYGEVTNPTAPPDELTFEENAAVWVFTGLIALATPEIGFAPAILFHTIAPKFIIAQKRGDIGTIIDIFVNGQQQAHVDTTANTPGDIIEIPVLPETAGGGYDLLVMNTLP